MKLATQDKPFFPESFFEKFTLVKSMGFDGFEIDGRELLNRFDEVKKAMADADLPVVTVCGGYRGWIGDFDEEKRKLCIKDIAEILNRLSLLSGKGIVVPAAWGMFSKRLPPMVPPRSEEEDRKVLLESLDRLNRVAESTGTLIYLEPLNRYEDHMLNRLGDAVSIIREGKFSYVKVTADFYHMNIEEPRIDESLREAKDLIGHIHLADSHRYEPGTGHLDFIPGFKALTEMGYDGYLTFECRVIGNPPEEAYKQSVRYIGECLEKAKK
ncbi:putative isomerase/epimerase [[Clostridium] ultunense Esp]|uniref:sugar phosphate isomerase/epimerase family protein n=1 Tax=Thermicanus aegyptius TaxID=94009 RepID=UPI0002B70DF5|nr:sugar phosphate isomerase/epimerase family protein [Thermicanus aegyptius]CCQ96492.1 putative isomerase/epimerase [[Clostridium] ultunense Esp]